MVRRAADEARRLSAGKPGSCSVGIPRSVPVSGYAMCEVTLHDSHRSDLAWAMVQLNYYHGIAEFARRLPEDELHFLGKTIRTPRRVWLSCETQLQALRRQTWAPHPSPDAGFAIENATLLHIALLEGCFQAAAALLLACPQMLHAECSMGGIPLKPSDLALLLLNLLQSGCDVSSGQQVASAYDFLNGFRQNWIIGNVFPYVSQHTLTREERCANMKQVLRVLAVAEHGLSNIPLLVHRTAAERVQAAGHCGVGAMAAMVEAATQAYLAEGTVSLWEQETAG